MRLGKGGVGYRNIEWSLDCRSIPWREGQLLRFARSSWMKVVRCISVNI